MLHKPYQIIHLTCYGELSICQVLQAQRPNKDFFVKTKQINPQRKTYCTKYTTNAHATNNSMIPISDFPVKVKSKVKIMRYGNPNRTR